MRPVKQQELVFACGAPATTVPNGFGPKGKVFFASKNGNFHRNNAMERFWPPGPTLSRYISLMLVRGLGIAPCK